MSQNTIPGTDDKRVTISPMRHAYRVLTDEEKALITAIKDAGEDLLKLIPASSRCNSVAITKVEEAVMWAVKGITA